MNLKSYLLGFEHFRYCFLNKFSSVPQRKLYELYDNTTEQSHLSYKKWLIYYCE